MQVWMDDMTLHQSDVTCVRRYTGTSISLGGWEGGGKKSNPRCVFDMARTSLVLGVPAVVAVAVPESLADVLKVLFWPLLLSLAKASLILSLLFFPNSISLPICWSPALLRGAALPGGRREHRGEAK